MQDTAVGLNERADDLDLFIRREASFWSFVRRLRNATKLKSRAVGADASRPMSLRVYRAEDDWKREVYNRAPGYVFKTKLKEGPILKQAWKGWPAHSCSRFVLQFDSVMAMTKVFPDVWDLFHWEGVTGSTWAPTVFPKGWVTKDAVGTAISGGTYSRQLITPPPRLNAPCGPRVEFETNVRRGQGGIIIGKRYARC